VIIDDIISTGGTLVNAANMLKEKGARSIQVCISHALLCGNAVEKIQQSAIDRLFVTDAVPVPPEKKIDKIHIVSLDDLIASEISELQSFQP
jgi:ribose-phosphate pyrophosphokinase